jgi:hypothetical protein
MKIQQAEMAGRAVIQCFDDHPELLTSVAKFVAPERAVVVTEVVPKPKFVKQQLSRMGQFLHMILIAVAWGAVRGTRMILKPYLKQKFPAIVVVEDIIKIASNPKKQVPQQVAAWMVQKMIAGAQNVEEGEEPSILRDIAAAFLNEAASVNG